MPPRKKLGIDGRFCHAPAMNTVSAHAQPRSQRTILHVDMDAFYASVEQHDHPEWKGLPVVVGSAPDRRGVVAAASYEARVFGIRSAMPSREAGRRCPHAVFVRPRMPRYLEASKQVFRIFERFTPHIEPLSIDEAFLDVTGAHHLYGNGFAVARSLRAAIRAETGLTASVGIAPNMFLAKLGSELNKPDGITEVPRDEPGILAFLAPLPIERLWGVGRVTAEALRRAGLRTIGDLQQRSEDALRALLGAASARHFRQLAYGRDPRPVRAERADKSLSREHTFDADESDRDIILRTLNDLVDDVGRRLRASGRHAGVARIRVRWSTFKTLTRQQPLRPPCCDDFRLRETAHVLFDSVQQIHPVRLIGFGVEGLVRTISAEPTLFDPNPRPDHRERLSRTVDHIRARHGPGSIRRGDVQS